jgi:hypothetical protein
MSTSVRVDVAPALLLWAKELARLDGEHIAKVAPKFHEWISGK